MTLSDMNQLHLRWGLQRTETALMFISNMVDHRGLPLWIEPTIDMVDAMLSAVLTPEDVMLKPYGLRRPH